MRSLRNYNSKKYDMSRYFDGLDVNLLLVFQVSNVVNKTSRDVDLIIGKRRKLPLCLDKSEHDSDVYMIVEKNDVIIAYDKLVISKDADSQREMIDIEGYLNDKGYKYSQLDSKKYSRERAKKNTFVYSEIHKYGEFEADRTWLDIDVFDATAVLFPGACKVGDIDVVAIDSEAFDNDMVEILREMTEKKHIWNTQLFTEFFVKLLECNQGSIITETGRLNYSRRFTEEGLEIIRNFDDGDYTYEVSIDKYGESQADNVKLKLGTFIYAIMNASSLEECKRIEAKSKLLFGSF